MRGSEACGNNRAFGTAGKKRDFPVLNACPRPACPPGIRDVDRGRVGRAPDIGDSGGRVFLSETIALPRAD